MPASQQNPLFHRLGKRQIKTVVTATKTMRFILPPEQKLELKRAILHRNKREY
jgi:hypothetical protein